MNPKKSLIIRAVELYYQRGVGQNEVAKILGVSRSTVSRLLSEARDTGVVMIKVNTPIEKNIELSERLRTELGLLDAIVVPTEKVAEAAAELLSSLVENKMTIGISWGRTLSEMLAEMSELDVEQIEVVQMVGSLGAGDPQIDGVDIARVLAEKLHGKYRYVHSPAVVESNEVKKVLLNQPQISETLDRASQATMMVLGIGSIEDTTSSLLRTGYLTEEERVTLLEQGVVGHLLARMIDINGNEIQSFNDRVVGVPLHHLRKAKWTIGVCDDEIKASALLGAIRGKYINTLVVDEQSAREVLLKAGK